MKDTISRGRNSCTAARMASTSSCSRPSRELTKISRGKIMNSR